MEDRHEFSVDYQVKQARKLKHLIAENNRLTAKNKKLKEELEKLKKQKNS